MNRDVRNTLLVMALALVVSVVAMYRMDYIASPRAEYVRMTDSARNAYIAKNLVDGKGYTTNEIPSALIGFYQQRGKLQDTHWANADRFPFTTVAIASLYTVTGTADWWVGITLYNILAFSILITLIYRLAISIFRNHAIGLIAVTVALLHHGTYYLLYQKDADSVALTIGVLLALIKWLDTPRLRRIRWTPVLGTLLAWLFLARPNVGLPFLFYLLVELIGWVRDRSDGPQGRDKLRHLARTYGALAAVFLVWTMPYVIYSMTTWGSPFFSANSLYQLPLGTRLSLGGDTWWKYYGPEQVLSFSNIMAEVPREIAWKVVTSWLLTFRLCLASYITEFLVLVFARFTIWRHGVDGPDQRPRASVRTVGRVLLAIVLFNFLILPLFGWAYFPWKQYLVFALPWVWVFVACALYRLFELVRARLPTEPSTLYLWVFAGFVVVILLGSQHPANDGDFLTPALTRWAWFNWRLAAMGVALIVVLRPSRMTPVRATVLAGLVILAAYRPSIDLKSDSLNYFPMSDGVAQTLRQRKGLVSSLALQSEVSWLSGRKHIPVPENALLLYKYHSDFGLEVEDVYLESAETMVAPPFGPFSRFMPALESYARLERYQAPLPGYEIVFRHDGKLGYPAYDVPVRPKASTIYRLTDPAARDAIQTSPETLVLGDVRNTIYLTHGFGGFFELDGRHVVAQTNATRLRYRGKPPLPWEDSSISFFVKQRKPTRVTVSLFVPAPVRLDVYWNLDLDVYDLPRDRAPKHLGAIEARTAGWQTVTLEVPAHLPREGLNKLGFRASAFTPAMGCLDGSKLCDTTVGDKPSYLTKQVSDAGPMELASLFESVTFGY